MDSTVGSGVSDSANASSQSSAEEKRMSQEELRQKLSDVLRAHTELQTAIQYAFSGKAVYEKKAQLMAEDAFMAALQPIIMEHYDGMIGIATDESGRVTFIGNEE